MPQSWLHTSFPGLQPASTGFMGRLTRILFILIFFGLALFVLLFTLILGLFWLFLRALGLGPKHMPAMPTRPFGFPFPPSSPPAPNASQTPPVKPSSPVDTPDRLEAFHGSLDEFMQKRKDTESS